MDTKLLIERCCRNDGEAIRFLYGKYVDKLFRVCIRYMGNISDAEDCISSVFMKILAGLKTAKFENEQKFQAWICRIAANECLMKLRKEIKFEKLSEKDEYHTIYPDNILEDIEASYLLTLIQSLPLGYRTIFNMYAIEGYSHNEIAKQLGISVGTSKSQLSKARAELQTKLKGRLQ